MIVLAMDTTSRTLDVIAERVARLRQHFESGLTRPLAFRLEQLAGLARFLTEQERPIEDALHQDLGKPRFESFTAEIAFLSREIAEARKKLPSWTRPRRVGVPLFAWPGKARIYQEPLGVVLIVSPWNYPIQLALGPLLGALAAGNGAVVKPSEIAPATSKLLATLLPTYVDARCLQVVEGGVQETTALLTQRFDHIFYTGSGTVGRVILEAAAKHLTPVTLELGGKSPCIVDRHADLAIAARRIVWGKFYNAGQTCVAPDYVLAHEAVHDQLLERMKQVLGDFYGADPRTSPDYGRIVSARHVRRLVDLLPGSGTVVAGGEANADERYFAPTILRDVPADAPVMADEIFGPILPVFRVRSIDEALTRVNARPKPLALYLFSNDRTVQARVLEGTSSGGVLINHTTMHEVVSPLPFGGVGASGMGAYHGRASFETFSHPKSVLVKSTWFDLSVLYPPYSDKKRKWLRRLLSW
jgi:aldehyde dehydrogenase (NAD+)